MKLLLVAPASGGWRAIGRQRFFNGRTFRFSLQSLLSVAAATPPSVEVQIVDEQFQDVDWAGTYDLVGITCMTALAPRAYEVAARFRARGVRVVMGGMHPTLFPEEAEQHADAIVIGEVEPVWTQLLEDARHGRLQRRYRGLKPYDLSLLQPLPSHLLASGHYARVHSVQASRGCPNHCLFCSVAAFHGGTQRFRPVEQVVDELRFTPHRRVVFTDDNLMSDRDYARRLLESLAPLGKRWVTQTTLGLGEDPELVRLAAKAGCVGVFVGLESFGQANLDCIRKEFNRRHRYGQAIELLHRHGIGVEAGIVLGLPHDGPGVFEETLRAVEELAIDAVQVSCYTPLPGTPLYDQLRDRIFDRDWSHYDFHHAVFHPERMTAQELQDGHDWLTCEFYRPWRIARRLSRLLGSPRTWRIFPFSAVLNLAYLGRVVRWGLKGAVAQAQKSADRVRCAPGTRMVTVR